MFGGQFEERNNIIAYSMQQLKTITKCDTKIEI